MSNIAIQVENLGKLYRLGEVGTGTLGHDLNRWIAKVRGKEDPFSKIGETNDRTKKGDSEYVWALKDVDFKIEQGQAVGIVGRNGAGKSTLLKLLSKVTQPTTGIIKIKGRIASLLEVGTGFHPEMTGRENIFLNGAIMGMTKKEIKAKFDEIVDFAGVERYIDTPVKRYSSGMYVRLAFAVAAHLEPEILIVDEVLAVGDAEFQKKCLGKMKDVSEGEGRTILFVSHNISAINSLCTHGILMANGTLECTGPIDKIVGKYMKGLSVHTPSLEKITTRKGNGALQFTSIELIDSNGVPSQSFLQGGSMDVELSFSLIRPELNFDGLHFSVNIININGEVVIHHTTKLIGMSIKDIDIRQSNRIMFNWPTICLAPGTYTINIDCVHINEYVDAIEGAAKFTIVENTFLNYYMAPTSGIFAIAANWNWA